MPSRRVAVSLLRSLHGRLDGAQTTRALREGAASPSSYVRPVSSATARRIGLKASYSLIAQRASPDVVAKHPSWPALSLQWRLAAGRLLGPAKA
jgi:hypothetical protein